MRSVATALVDDSTLFLEGLEKILLKSGFTVNNMVASPDELAAQSSLAPELTMLGSHHNDAQLLEDIITIRAIYPGTRIVVLSDDFDNQSVLEALRVSACGCLMRTINSQSLIRALELIMAGKRVVPSLLLDHIDPLSPPPLSDDDTQTLFLDSHGHVRLSEEIPVPLEKLSLDLHSNLSRREVDVLQLLVKGQSNKSIARTLDVVEATIKVHIKSILRKIKVDNRTQAAMWAIEHH